MSKINDFITTIGLDDDEAIIALKQWKKWKESQKKYQQKYYQKNKQILDEYRSEYSRTHPLFRQKNAERTRKNRHKSMLYLSQEKDL